VFHMTGVDAIVDLGGNLSEWARDTWAQQADVTWNTSRPMIDPVNTTPSAIDGDQRVARGGNWSLTALTTRGGFRRKRPLTQGSEAVTGFRCARASQQGP
jgi:formylglycine-generating enzyme required for sulfatase activity